MAIAIQAKDLEKRYGPQVLFDDAEVGIGATDRVGVIGRNGAGKSTFCRMLTGHEEPDSGVLSLHPKVRLGYLEQQPPYDAGETVMQFLARYTAKESWECGKAAGRFHLKGSMLDEPVESLSGGYQTRVKLAALVLREPNFLILDEPTNYLDLRTLVLLERFLASFSGGYLIVSHDREFLKRTCDKTLDIGGGALTLFPGSVEAYLEYDAEQQELEERRHKNVEAKKRQLQEFVDRYRVRAATASRAQSKLKQMSKLGSVELRSSARTVNIRLPSIDAKKGIALTCDGLSIGYGDFVVADQIHAEVERGERVAVLGNNGEGKTTFLRTIAGELERLAGSYQWARNLTVAYYAQHVYSSIPEHFTIEEYLAREAAQDVLRQEILDLAGCFLFHGDDVAKKVRVLSGGERARLCLAGLLLSKRQVLLLDEPTNHLDFETVESLGRALSRYEGSVFFVSHDRTFVNLVATTIFEVQSKRITKFPGDYATYVWRIEQEVDEAESELMASSRSENKQAGKGAVEYAERKKRRNRLSKLKKLISASEEQVSSYEAEKAEINKYYLENPLDFSKERQTRLEELDRLLAETEADWIAYQEEHESLSESDS